MVRVKYVGEDRTGYIAGQGSGGLRLPVPGGSKGHLVTKARSGCLVEFLIDNRKVRFWCPSHQLRRLVKPS